jgi:nitrous oxide reductase accessory protein NosL
MKKFNPGPIATLSIYMFFLCFCLIDFARADEQFGIEVDKEDRCPVCAMQVALYPKFACAMELVDGRKFSFCATGRMIRSWLNPEVYLGAEKADIQHVWVQDYFTGEKIDGSTAFWVAGSDVIGPMGPAFVPLKSESDVKAFKRRHGGKTVFHLTDLTDDKWNEITGK